MSFASFKPGFAQGLVYLFGFRNVSQRDHWIRGVVPVDGDISNAKHALANTLF